MFGFEFIGAWESLVIRLLWEQENASPNLAAPTIYKGTVMKTLTISGKCSDMCDYRVLDADGNVVAKHDGYVPSGFGIGGGDYISLTIDIETGTIVNWDAEKAKAVLGEE